MHKNQCRLAGALLLSLCVVYAKSPQAGQPAETIADGQHEKAGEGLKEKVHISAGGPYFATAGKAISLHGTYRVDGETEDMEHLAAIGKAILAYAHDHDSYPPAALRNSRGKMTVSWRVLLLPYLGEESLYRQFDLSKPWNSPENIYLLRRMPEVYRKSGYGNEETGFAGVSGPGSLFGNNSKSQPGGHSLTNISATEKLAAAPVGEDVHLPWTAPGDIDINAAVDLGTQSGFKGQGEHFTPLLFLDGSVYLMPNDIGKGPMVTWTGTSIDSNHRCLCAPPKSLAFGLSASWNLGPNSTGNDQGWDVTFLAFRPGTYLVTLQSFDQFGSKYETSTKVLVR